MLKVIHEVDAPSTHYHLVILLCLYQLVQVGCFWLFPIFPIYRLYRIFQIQPAQKRMANPVTQQSLDVFGKLSYLLDGDRQVLVFFLSGC